MRVGTGLGADIDFSTDFSVEVGFSAKNRQPDVVSACSAIENV